MKSLVNGCAAAALLMGLAVQAHAAEITVHDAPIHVVPADDDDTGPAIAPEKAVQGRTTQAEAAPVRADPPVTKALVQPRAPAPAATLTPDENAFFTALGGRVTDA